MAATASHELPARILKAITLADHLDAAGIRSRRAAAMDAQQWAMLATAAAVHLPSAETQALAVSMLQAREDVRKQLACLRRRVAAVNPTTSDQKE